MDFSMIPSQPPPPGVMPNFNNPPSRADPVIAALIAPISLSMIFVVLWLYVRCKLTHQFGFSDYSLLAGYGFAITTSALALDPINQGAARQDWDLPLSSVPHIIQSVWWKTKTYVLSLGLTKIAILSIYPQISPSRSFQICVWTVVGIIGSITVSSILWTTLDCLSVKSHWDLQAQIEGKCKIDISFIAFTGATNILTDIMILIIPAIMLRHIALSHKKKIGVILLLATGSLASLISIGRVVTSIKLVTKPKSLTALLDLIIWSTSEMHAGVICACLPILRPLARYFPSLSGSFSLPTWKPQSNSQSKLGSNVKISWAKDRITSNKNHQAAQVNTSEEYILSDRIVVTRDYIVTPRWSGLDDTRVRDNGLDSRAHELGQK